MSQEPLFEIITGDEFRKETITAASSRKQLRTEPRLQTIWFALPSHQGFCTVPDHDEVQKMLKPEQLPYRDKYPTRYVYEISPGLFVCRDCFLMGADKDDSVLG